MFKSKISKQTMTKRMKGKNKESDSFTPKLGLGVTMINHQCHYKPFYLIHKAADVMLKMNM